MSKKKRWKAHGRPPKPVDKREGNGRAQRHRDHGTPELQARREFLAGKGDKALTTFPLGILLANEVITEEEYRAGCRFAWLHAVVIGKHSLAAIEFERSHGKSVREVDEDREAELQDRFRKSMDCFESRRQRDEIVSLCVYERVPRFMRPVIPTGRDILQAQIIKDGLYWLAESYGFIDRKRSVA